MLSLHSSRLVDSSLKSSQAESEPSERDLVKADDIETGNKPQDVHEQLEKLRVEFSRLQEVLKRESTEREKFERKVERLEKFCISRGYVPPPDGPTTESNSERNVSNEDEGQLVLHRPPTPHSPSQDSTSSSVTVSKDSPQQSEQHTHTTQTPSVPTFRFGEGNKVAFTGVKVQDHKFEFRKNQSVEFSFKREGLKRRHHEMSPPDEGYAFAFHEDLPRKSLRRQ